MCVPCMGGSAHLCKLLKKFKNTNLFLKTNSLCALPVPEGVSPLYAGVTPGSISKSQGGLPWGMHWPEAKRRARPKGVTKRDYKCLYRRTGSINQYYTVRFMRRIRGISVRVSKHIIAKPNEHKKYTYVDATAIDRRSKLLPGEASLAERQRGVSRRHSSCL